VFHTPIFRSVPHSDIQKCSTLRYSEVFHTLFIIYLSIYLFICLFIYNQKEYNLQGNVMITQVYSYTMYYNDVVVYSSCDISPQVPYKPKGQHGFSLLVFTDCSSGCNSGLGWAPRLL